MAKEIDKIIQSKITPKSNNVLWDDGENLKINRNGKWESAGRGAPMINIKYANLVELRNNNKLVAGMQYRITDYVTTTAQENTQSAGHPFDVIVLALSENTLSEEAYAIQSARDTDGYFANSNLSAWKLWYCLDNDAERFAWADNRVLAEITYYDDTNDFDKIDGSIVMLKRYSGEDIFIEGSKLVYQYWLSNGVSLDCTEDGRFYYGDDDALYGSYKVQTHKGKGVIYRMIDEFNNDCPYDFKNIQFKRFAVTECEKSPALVVDNEENYYGYYYGALTLDGSQAIQDATYGEDFVWVFTFALKDLATDLWHDYTILNSIGLKTDESVIITCHSNVIKEHRDEYLGEHGRKAIWLNNIVFFNCYADISSPDYADEYSLCYYNSFGNGCYSNSFGNYCDSNSFGNGCYYNSFKDQDGIADNAMYNRLDDGVNNIVLHYDDNNGNYGELKNHHVCRGCKERNIEIYQNRDFETTYAMTSDGNLREFVLADLKAS